MSPAWRLPHGALAFVLLVTGALAGCIDPSGPGDDADGAPMTVVVTIPTDTPPGDIVRIQLGPASVPGLAMDRVDPTTWRIELTRDDEGLDADEDEEGGTFLYRYYRNGWDVTAEALPDSAIHPAMLGDDTPAWLAKWGTGTFRSGAVVEDVVTRWRFFPPDGTPIDRTSDLEPAAAWRPRMGNVTFRSAQVLQDLYIDGFEPFYGGTADRMVAVGYNWVVFAPPWNVPPDPDPGRPDYPDAATIEAHIEAFRARGLNVMIQPLSTAAPPVPGPDGTAAEWDEWAAWQTNYMVANARLANRTGADALVSFAQEYIDDADADRHRRELWTAVKAEFDGEVGEIAHPFLLGDGPPTTIPEPGFFDGWADLLDLFVFQTDAALTDADAPTAAEMSTGAGDVLDVAHVLVENHSVPVMVWSTYLDLERSWKGAPFYETGSIPGESADEIYVGHNFSGDDKARVVHAMFTAMADRPWVVGYAQLGYWHWDMPRLPDWSVRGKPAEDVWMRWNAHVLGDAMEAG